MSIAAWRSPGRGRAHRSLLVATSPVRDLLIRAKDLFVAANVAGIHRTEIDRTLRRTLARPREVLGWTLSTPRHNCAKFFARGFTQPEHCRLSAARSKGSAQQWQKCAEDERGHCE